ncbi:type I 3-dehydroquinate dehydratase [Haladaptatus caseinilyticus]|uniref:type I 3-dehydroquinate dehydratase n=1 Tax=Haladaptatus caseinilyticus TaxID=2993314 RepID=UPI00224B0374|nr:type I 3-dehydroquinate dehydratase [Haladaptatus caseinilyticus]
MEFDSFALMASTATLGDEPRVRDHADMVEFRMDLATDPLDQLAAYDGELPILATNRASWEGGKATGGETRLDALETAVQNDAVAAIDLELETLLSGDGKRVIEQARQHDAAVVASIHDFETTPPKKRMYELLERATDHADVGKLAVTANSRSDVLDLFSVTDRLTEDGRRVATIAMGEIGRHSRAVAPVYGSKIGYAPLDSADATAPGQYDLATLSHLVQELS